MGCVSCSWGEPMSKVGTVGREGEVAVFVG